MSVGYCTLYGDMNGGLAVIADLPRMMVYRISRWRNRSRPDIPEAILAKAPSAELRPGQTDQDSLPPYEVLDQILELHIEQYQSARDIVARGFDSATVARVFAPSTQSRVQAQAGRASLESNFEGFRPRLADAYRAAVGAAATVAILGRSILYLPFSLGPKASFCAAWLQ